MFPVYEVMMAREEGGREGAILPRTNLWKALQQMIQIRFMLKCVFTHRDT